MNEQKDTIRRSVEEHSTLTIADIAKNLGVSKTTVSRAISGKGRIGEQTRKRVLEYIEKTNYRPNIVAKGLAKSKTYNIGWVMPGETSVTDLPFFQRCLLGISQVAYEKNYDVLVTMVYRGDYEQLKRAVINQKMDGVILGRTLQQDEGIRFLQEYDMPFVAIGSSDIENVVQVDHQHEEACMELTERLIQKGVKEFAFIGGESRHVVNQSRLRGFCKALDVHGISREDCGVYMGCEDAEQLEEAVEECMKKQVECIMCADDGICGSVVAKLKEDGIAIPEQVKVASFYNSVILRGIQSGITAVDCDSRKLGQTACNLLLDYLHGKEVPRQNWLGYDILMKQSTE